MTNNNKNSNNNNNPAQWTSFENWSVSYAKRIELRVEMLQAVTIFLQRWWRQRRFPRRHQRLLPVIVVASSSTSAMNNGGGGGALLRPYAHNIRDCVRHLTASSATTNQQYNKDPILNREVFAFEKLDGTNVGVRCDGAIFGRRQQIHGDSYQRVPLRRGGVLPDADAIQRVKCAIASAISVHMTIDKQPNEDEETFPSLVVYGELMCNPSRYSYDERGMGRKWYAFGAVLHSRRKVPDKKSRDIFTPSDNEIMLEKLLQAGFLATMSPETGKITLRLGKRLLDIFEATNIPHAPLLESGPLGHVCSKLFPQMMECKHYEGIVLCGDNFLKKWKTGKEDESRGYSMLMDFANRDPTGMIRTLARVDGRHLDILTQVAGSKPKANGRQKKKNKAPKSSIDLLKQQAGIPEEAGVPSLYSNIELAQALHSALTKYDIIESYFDCNSRRDEIICLLINEVAQDLECDQLPAPDQRHKIVETFVKKFVGKRFGKWKYANQPSGQSK